LTISINLSALKTQRERREKKQKKKRRKTKGKRYSISSEKIEILLSSLETSRASLFFLVAMTYLY
jgi:hypothetical protein